MLCSFYLECLFKKYDEGFMVLVVIANMVEDIKEARVIENLRSVVFRESKSLEGSYAKSRATISTMGLIIHRF